MMPGVLSRQRERPVKTGAEIRVVTSQGMPMIVSCHQRLAGRLLNTVFLPALRRLQPNLTCSDLLRKPAGVCFSLLCSRQLLTAALVNKCPSLLAPVRGRRLPFSALVQLPLSNLSFDLSSHPALELECQGQPAPSYARYIPICHHQCTAGSHVSFSAHPLLHTDRLCLVAGH